MNDLPLLRRPVTINLTQRANASGCDECGARHTGMCGVLTEEDLGFLSSVAQRITVAAGDVFMEEGDKATYFFNLNQGNVRLFKSLPDGRRQITGFAGPGYFLALAQSDKYVFSAEAMDSVKLCRFNRISLMAVFEEFPALERKLLDAAMHELVIAQQHMLLLGRKTAVERVASFLLSWAERLEVCGVGVLPKPGSVLHLPLSRMDLADYLGLTIETVSRSLGQLKREGMIDVPSIHEIILLKPKGLSDIADAV